MITDFQTETLQGWTSKLAKFVITTATQYIYKCIQENNLILIVGPTGSGKSANAYHVAFRLKEESGYTVIPTRQSTDITHYHIPDKKQVFVVDDFIGKFAVDEMNAGLWEQNWSLLNMILSDNINTKLILTIRTYVWQSERYKYLSMSAFTCDLLSDKISLSLKERRDICKSYLNEVDMEALKDDTILMYSFLPSLCSSYMSYESSNNISVEQFFTVPNQIIEDEIYNFKIKSQVSFVALAILAIKQTISKNSFSIDSHEYDKLVKDVFHESAFLQYPSKSLLRSSLVAFTGTYVKVTIDSFMFTNEKLQNIVLRSISKLLIRSVIKHCQTEVILNQIRLDCFIQEHSVLTIEASNENEDTYFRRLADEVGGESNTAIFENEQNKFPEFRLKFVKYMKKYVSRDYLTKNKASIPVLHVVSALGYHDYAAFFIQDTQMVNKKDSNGNIPLHVACMKGHMKIVKLLVENKSLIDIANIEGLKPFWFACENDNIQIAKYLLHHSSSSIDVNEKYEKRSKGSVLHIASAKGLTELVILLLKNKADANVQDANGCTPLHFTCDIAVIQALLAFKADIDAVDFLDRSPLYRACSENHERVIHFLIKNNASVNQKTITGFTPLHSACQSGRIQIVKMLLENGANINSSKPDTVPLHEACKVGNVNVIKILIASEASVNHPSKDGSTPLHEACSNCHIETVKLLLDNKANVNAENEIGWTALFFSCFHGFCEIVMLLLSRGANTNIIDKNKVSPLLVACKENHTDVVHVLLRSKANVNHCDKDKCSSILIACKAGNVDLVSVLLRYSADISLADNDMISPLHAACMNNNNTKLVLKLVENNANINVTDKTGHTPLFKATSNGFTDIVDILLPHGASVDIRDKSGNSSLAIAEKKGHTTIVDVLRKFKHDNQIV